MATEELIPAARVQQSQPMKRTVILFRGVGGKTQLPTQALREKLTEAGFENVATYINSGNAIVRCRLSRSRLLPRLRTFAASISISTRWSSRRRGGVGISDCA